MANKKKELNKKVINNVITLNKKKTSINKGKNNISKKKKTIRKPQKKTVNAKKTPKNVLEKQKTELKEEKIKLEESKVVIKSKKKSNNKKYKVNKTKKIKEKNKISLIKRLNELIKNKKIKRKNKREEKKLKKLEKKNIKPQKNKKGNRFKKIKNLLQKVFNFIKNKKYYIICFIAIIFLIIGIFFVINRTPKELFLTFKEYEIGNKVTLTNNTTWYVIKDSDKTKASVELISEKLIDINKDGKIDDKDKIAYDSDNNYEYNKKSEKNIAYYLNENKDVILNDLDKLKVKEIRLLTSDEYIEIRKSMKFGYDWNEGNWLASKEVSSWWLETIKYNKIYVVNKKGSYKLSEANQKNYVRPVIKIDKSLIEKLD